MELYLTEEPIWENFSQIWSMVLPARFGDARNEASTRHFAESETGHLEATDESTAATSDAAAIGEARRAGVTRQEAEADVIAFCLQLSTKLRVFFNSFCFALLAL